MPSLRPRPILIAGPTASGKSALALAIAARHGGVVINADSMQVYRELCILSARPSPEEEAAVPHRLYGYVAAAEAYSVARWLADAEREIEAAITMGLNPIVVGGTGLYFKALAEGLSPVPEIPAAVRARWRGLASAEGAGTLYRELSARDPLMAARLNPADTQRLTRALEVIDATGRSLADWQAMPGRPVVALADCMAIHIDLPRDVLHERCDRRFDQMMSLGADNEVRALLSLDLDRKLPIFGALGVAAMTEWIEGRATREAAIERGKLETRQYVKRQQTWMKRHMMAWTTVQSTDYCELKVIIEQFIDSTV